MSKPQIKVTAIIEGDATDEQVMRVTNAMKKLGDDFEWHVKGTIHIKYATFEKDGSLK